MGLNWNEIKSRALHFSKTWADASNEDSEAKPFWIAFFEIFGITDKRVATEQAAQCVLGARAQFASSSLAAPYDPPTMPQALLKAHQKLNAAVDATNAEREAFLFELYQRITSLLPAPVVKKMRKTKSTES